MLLVYLFYSILSITNGYKIDLSFKDRLFNGIGGLSAGASSRLLIDYSEPYRSQILDYLFLPSFGASLSILKVEIGGDTWSTCGTEPSHMHTNDLNDVNYFRGYEYWLMLEAKKRNPLIKIYALSWGFPSWIGSGALNENMANYTVLWIKGTEEQLNLTVNYVGIWNEDSWSTSYVKLLRSMLDDNNLNHVELVVADNFVSNVNPLISQINNDSSFNSSFNIIGIHYPPSEKDTQQMWETGKTLWASEDFFTNNNIEGGGCWGRVLNWNYIYGNYSATISWSIISSWYEYLPYFGDGLMSASWPWNGYYQVMSPIWMSAHTTQFVDSLNSNWYYIKQGYGSGILNNNGGTYVTYISNNDINNKKQLNISIVIETFEYQHSLCRMNPSDFWNVTTQNITFQLQNDNNKPYVLPKQLYVWKSILVGDNSYLFEKQDPIAIKSDLSFSLMNVEPNAVITLTTISTGKKGSYPAPPAKVKFPLPYSDNFDSYSNAIKNGIEPQPKYFSDQGGSFVIKNALKKSSNDYAFEQVVPFSPSLNNTGWHNGDPPQPLTIIGDYNITDCNVSVEAYIVSNNQYKDNFNRNNIEILAWNTSNIMIALRLGGTLSGSGCRGDPREYPCVQAMGTNFFDYGYFLQINDNGYWKLMAPVYTNLIDGNLNMDLREKWFNVSLSIKGYTLSATFNGKLLFNQVVDSRNKFQSGWVGLSCGWQTCQFDNFMIS